MRHLSWKICLQLGNLRIVPPYVKASMQMTHSLWLNSSTSLLFFLYLILGMSLAYSSINILCACLCSASLGSCLSSGIRRLSRKRTGLSPWAPRRRFWRPRFSESILDWACYLLNRRITEQQDKQVQQHSKTTMIDESWARKSLFLILGT